MKETLQDKCQFCFLPTLHTCGYKYSLPGRLGATPFQTDTLTTFKQALRFRHHCSNTLCTEPFHFNISCLFRTKTSKEQLIKICSFFAETNIIIKPSMEEIPFPLFAPEKYKTKKLNKDCLFLLEPKIKNHSLINNFPFLFQLMN